MPTTERARQERSLYSRLIVFEDDLRQAAYFAKHLLKKGWHYDPWDAKIRWPTYMQQAAFTTALVTAYCRPFSGANGYPTLSMKLAPYDSPQRALHSKLRSLRNSVYAHSEVQQQNVRPVSILGRATAMVSQPVMKLSREEVEMILDMTHITSQAIREKLQSLIERVESET